MEWISDNWIYLAAVIAFIFVLIYGLMTGKVKRWLEWAVSAAERDLGSGTGQLKLREVYNWFIDQFPFFSKIVPFPVFSNWVDIALDWMRDQLDKNESIKAVIKDELY